MKIGMKMKHTSKLFLRGTFVYLVLTWTLFLFSSANAEEITKTVKVKLFFPRDGMENGQTQNGTQLRNWYYFWKQGSVVSNLGQFEYQNQGGYGAYNIVTHKLYIRNATPTSDNYSVTFKNLYYKTTINSGPDGIAHSIAQEDDIQVVSAENGKPNTVAITAGANGILSTVPSGDDTVSGNTIITGVNGICNTLKSGDDVQVIPVGNGEPNSTIITAGPDNFMHSADDFDRKRILRGDDILDLTNTQIVTHAMSCSGIDCCAETISHELKHKELCEAAGSSTYDGDWILDSYELASPYHLDPKRADTYDCTGAIGYGDDNEFLARMAESNPVSSDASKDWSDTNGKNL